MMALGKSTMQDKAKKVERQKGKENKRDENIWQCL